MLLLSHAVQEPPVPRPAEEVRDEERVVAGRLLDVTSGAPVAGAICELWTEDEDQPRLVESSFSRADGSYELHALAPNETKVRLRAPGYRSAVVAAPQGDLELLYPNDEPLVVRVLDLDGNPIAGARVRSHETCRHAPAAVEAVSGADGRAVLDGAPIRTSTDYEVRAPGYGAVVPVYFEDLGSEPIVFLPRRAPVRLRLLDEDGRPLAHMRFRQQGPAPTAFVTDANGCALLDSLFESREIGLEDATKRLHLSGWPPLEGELLLSPGREVGMEERESWPELHIVGGGPYSTMHVQFGDDSVTRLARSLDVRVRPGVTVTVLASGEDVRRARLEPWSGKRELDLADPALLFRPRFEPGEPVTLAFRVESPEGQPLAVEGRLGWSSEQPPDEDPLPDAVAFRVPRGARYVVRFLAEGHLPLARIGRARESMRSTELVVLPRL